MPRSHAPKHVTRKSAKASLALLLCGCTAERLASFTAAGLASTHNVSLKTAETMLAAARMARG